MVLDKSDETGIFYQNLSRDNETVQEVAVYITADPGDGASYAIWNKVAEGIGNLHALRKISVGRSVDDEGEEVASDWEILACILRRLRPGIQLCMENHQLLWNAVALPGFHGVIHGQSIITGSISGAGFPFHCLDISWSTLLTLPELEKVSFYHIDDQGTDEGYSLEIMFKLQQ
jgi:hypothetical protein